MTQRIFTAAASISRVPRQAPPLGPTDRLTLAVSKRGELPRPGHVHAWSCGARSPAPTTGSFISEPAKRGMANAGGDRLAAPRRSEAGPPNHCGEQPKTEGRSSLYNAITSRVALTIITASRDGPVRPTRHELEPKPSEATTTQNASSPPERFHGVKSPDCRHSSPIRRARTSPYHSM